jgi:hypothetical protein
VRANEAQGQDAQNSPHLFLRILIASLAQVRQTGQVSALHGGYKLDFGAHAKRTNGDLPTAERLAY